MQVPHHNYEVSGNVQTPYRGFAPGPHRGFPSPRPSVFDLQQKNYQIQHYRRPPTGALPLDPTGGLPQTSYFRPLSNTFSYPALVLYLI